MGCGLLLLGQSGWPKVCVGKLDVQIQFREEWASL